MTDASDLSRFGGQDEQEFLEGIRARQRAGQPAKARPQEYPPPRARSDEGERLSYQEKAALFIQSLEAVGGVAKRAADLGEAYALICSALAEREVRRVVLGDGDWSELLRQLDGVGIGSDLWKELTFAFGTAERSLEQVNRWGAGISWADYGVAELGSVALLAAPEQGRSVSLVPPFYITLIAGDRLVYSRRSVLRRVAEAARPSRQPPALTFVTGPSRSADIEMDLSVGVHGPGAVLAILVDSV